MIYMLRHSYDFGMFTIVLFVAEIHCGDLETPSHGTKYGPNDVVGSQMTFSCNSGYRLEGSEQRHCKEDGQWDGTNATCSKCCQYREYQLLSRENTT